MTAVEVWAWEGKCCLAVKAVTSSIWRTLEALTSLISLKIVSVIQHNITLDSDLWAGQVQHWPQQNLVVHGETLPGPLHTATAREGPQLLGQSKWNEARPAVREVSPPFSGEILARASSFPFSDFDSHRLCWAPFTCTWSVHMFMHFAQDLSLCLLFIVSTHSDLTTSVVVFLARSSPVSLSPSLLVHPYIFIFNFSFAESLFSSWLLYCSFSCCCFFCFFF